MLEIRNAEKSEIPWINACYDEVEFVHSIYEREKIAIAELDGQKAGLGRLVRLDNRNFELGGMFVFNSFRGKGIAAKIVEFLLREISPGQHVYCIPFEPLIPFYHQFGFIPCTELESVPHDISTKYLWCKNKYTKPTSLLVLKANK